MTDVDHRLIKATPCLQWKDVPGALPTDPPLARSVSQYDLGLICMAGGFASPWLKQLSSALLISHDPAHANAMFDAWTGPGGLDLDVAYHDLGVLLRAVHDAKMAVPEDSRLSLVEVAFFPNEPKPLAGAGSANTRKWMYAFSGSMLLGEDDSDTKALAWLQKSVQPRLLSVSRDLSTDTHCRILSSLLSLARKQDQFIADALGDSNTPVEEIAEYVGDLWRRLIETGYPFLMEGKVAQRNMELGRAASLLNGDLSQKEAAFRHLFIQLSKDKRLIRKCVEEDVVHQDPQRLVANFEQLAGDVLPGVRWFTTHCVEAVEHELIKLKLEHLLNSWGDNPIEILSNLKQHLKQERAAVALVAKSAGGDLGAERGLNGTSGFEAKKDPAFLETKARLSSGSMNFLSALDIMLDSPSKIWYMKAINKMTLASQNTSEMEACTKHVWEWKRYWPMAISRDTSGKVHGNVQGECFPEEEVSHLLNGLWHQVDWVRLVQLMEAWTDDVQPEDSAHLGSFATLFSVKDILFKTMRLLKLASDGENEDEPSTCLGFMAAILKLERRSRALPEGSSARGQAVENVIAVFQNGLEEFGERWAKQWAKPTNYNEPLVLTFADSKCFIMRELDELIDIADTLHKFKRVLPNIMDGGAFAPKKKKHKPLEYEILSSDEDIEVPPGEALPRYRMEEPTLSVCLRS